MSSEESNFWLLERYDLSDLMGKHFTVESMVGADAIQMRDPGLNTHYYI